MATAGIKAAAYCLNFAPELALHYGGTPAQERKSKPDSEFLRALPEHAQTYEEAQAYAPNKTYIGAMSIDELEKELLAQNAEHKDWTCSEEMMKLTKDGKALYLHCLPADISGLSCPEGEVDNSVFDRYLVPLYKQASYKPYIIAAMIFLAQVKDPVKALMDLDSADNKRKMF